MTTEKSHISKGRKIEKWRNWRKVKREEVSYQAWPEVGFKSRESPSTSKPNPLDPSSLKKIDTKKKKQAFERKYSLAISRLSRISKPRICELSGHSIPDNDYFVFYGPERKIICRQCRQRNSVCLGCGDVLGPSEIHREIAYCPSCYNRGVCVCCRQKMAPDRLEYLLGKKGCYCSACLRSVLSCEYCGAPVPTRRSGLNLCAFCLSAAVRTKRRLGEIYSEVQIFFYNLDPEVPFEFRQTAMVPSFSPRPLPLSQSVCFVENRIDVDSETPEPYFYTRLCQWQGLKHLEGWSKIRDHAPIIDIFSIFFSFLFFESSRLFIQARSLKKKGFSRDRRRFLPLYRLFSEKGISAAYLLLKEKLT